MTKILLQQIQVEYEQTNSTIEELCSKYSCSTKDLKGYTRWEKKPQDSVDSSIKLIYETVFKPQIEDYIEMDPEEIEAEILSTAEDIKNHKPVTKDDLPLRVRDGFEGLRLLDAKLQTQAMTLLGEIDSQVHNCESAKDIRDLVAAHTAIRDSYFNTKAPMINILNGDVNNNTTNQIVQLLDEVHDDC